MYVAIFFQQKGTKMWPSISRLLGYYWVKKPFKKQRPDFWPGQLLKLDNVMTRYLNW